MRAKMSDQINNNNNSSNTLDLNKWDRGRLATHAYFGYVEVDAASQARTRLMLKKMYRAVKTAVTKIKRGLVAPFMKWNFKR